MARKYAIRHPAGLQSGSVLTKASAASLDACRRAGHSGAALNGLWNLRGKYFNERSEVLQCLTREVVLHFLRRSIVRARPPMAKGCVIQSLAGRVAGAELRVQRVRAQPTEVDRSLRQWSLYDCFGD